MGHALREDGVRGSMAVAIAQASTSAEHKDPDGIEREGRRTERRCRALSLSAASNGDEFDHTRLQSSRISRSLDVPRIGTSHALPP